MKYILWLNQISKKSIGLVGGKGANLGEMVRIGLPVPPAFVITVDAFKDFLERTKLKKEIYPILKKTDVHDAKSLEKNTKKIRDMMIKAKMPEEIKEYVIKAYEKIGKEEFVAVRSSATAEDLPGASFAGQQLTVLNVKGKKELLDAVKRCWASLFTARATFYRVEKGFDHEKVLIALPVQKMIQSEVAGVGFTIHPSTGDKTKVLMEGSWGLGESVVSGEVTPDTFVLDKKTGNIVEQRISKKVKMKIRKSKEGGVVEVKIPKGKQLISCLSPDQLKEFNKIARKLEEHYKFPQDFEWAIENGKIYLVQTRPVTAFFEEMGVVPPTEVAEPILRGLPASPGIGFGPVKIVSNSSELDKVKNGDILVTKMTNPDFVPAMKRAAGIVTNEGGLTSHASIVSRELGVPCVVGSMEATTKLKDGQVITIDGARGIVFAGKVEIKVKKEISVEEAAKLETKTKIYMNLGEPELIDKYKHLIPIVDGIGLFRAEFMAAEVGKHPKLLIQEGGGKKFVDVFARGIAKVAKALNPKPVVYRALDFKTNEYAGLEGGNEFEPNENNPMIGWRGASRYITEPEVFKLELLAIKKVQQEHGLNNIVLMIPFIRTVWEVKEIKKIIEEVGLKTKLWLMAEVPSIALIMGDFCKEGIDGVSIGSNDLTQLVLGVDRDSAILGKRWFDERDPAVMKAVEAIITNCKKYGITSSICGQAPSVYPEFTEQLIRWGITSVSVNPDAVAKTRKLVYGIEKKL